MALPGDYSYWLVKLDKAIINSPDEKVTVDIQIAVIQPQWDGYVASAGYKVVLNGIRVAQGIMEYFGRMGRAVFQISGFQPGINILDISVGAMATQRAVCGNTFSHCGQNYVNSCRWIEYLMTRTPCQYNDIIDEIAWDGKDSGELVVGMQDQEPHAGNFPVGLAIGAGVLVGGYFLLKRKNKSVS